MGVIATERFGLALGLAKPWSMVRVDMPPPKPFLLLLLQIASFSTKIFRGGDLTFVTHVVAHGQKFVRCALSLGSTLSVVRALDIRYCCTVAKFHSPTFQLEGDKLHFSPGFAPRNCAGMNFGLP